MNIDKYAVIQRQQLDKQLINTQFQQIQNDIPTYSYQYRYELKKLDKSKSRFCQDPLISKEYERILYEKFNDF